MLDAFRWRRQYRIGAEVPVKQLQHYFKALTSNRWLFVSLPLLYFLVYGRFGINEKDGGFITALAYRITHGAVPYKDFIWIYPPLSLYVHALILSLLPFNVAFISERLLFYIVVAAYCLLSVLTIEQYFPLARFCIGRYELATICFLFSVHSFPPMPWYTIDGIALSALGVFLIAGRSSAASSVIGMVAFVLAALTKQSFYPMPLVGLGLVLFLRRKHLLACLAATALATGCFLLLLAVRSSLSLFLIQTSGQTPVHALLDQGLRVYLRAPLGTVFLACMIAILDLRVFGKRLTAGSVASKAVLYFVLLFVVHNCVSSLDRRTFFFPVYDPMVVFLVGSLLLVALHVADKPQPSVVFASFLALAWCASISYGYATPVLFSTPLVLALIWLANQPGSVSPGPLYAAFVLGGALMSFVGYRYDPYLEAPRAELTEDAGQVFPKLSFIRTSPKKIAMYRELKELHSKYGDNYQTLPDFTYSHFLTDTNSPIQNDWPMNVEINFKPDAILERLSRLGTYVFVQKSALPGNTGGLFSSDVTNSIVRTWKRIDQTEFFLIYVKPEDSGEGEH